MLSYDLGEFDAACRAYERALESSPDDATVLMNLGNARDQMKDAPGARAAYERALKANPKRPDILFNYGVFLAERDPPQAFLRVRESIEACNAEGIEWDGDLAGSFLVRLAIDQSRVDEVLGFFESLGTRARYDVAVTCRLHRAHLLSRIGRHDEAIAEYRAWLPHDDSPFIAINLVFALCRAGRHDEAFAEATKLRHPWSDFAEGHILEARGNKTHAVGAYRRFLSGAPSVGPFPADPVLPLVEHARAVVGGT